MKHPKVCIIVLNWNGLKDTMECLESLKAVDYPDYEVVVVDNASAGGDAVALKSAFGNSVRIIENDKNYGYTGGNNIGMRFCLARSQPDYLLILNNDIAVAPDFLSHLVRAAEASPLVGMAGPKVYYFDEPKRIQNAGTVVNLWKGEATPVGLKQMDSGQFDSERQVDCVSGSCLLIRRALVDKVGMFDESYFAYWDETDYCTRARRAGYMVMYVPQAKVWHKNPIKRKIWEKTTRGKTATQRYYYSARNNFRFMRMHATGPQYLTFLICFFGCRFWTMAGTCLLYDRSLRQFAGFCRGVKDGMLGTKVTAPIPMGREEPRS